MAKNIPTIRVTNSLGRKREVLETRTPGKLTMYSCGPTVYNLIHIGNLRAALVADLFFRVFRRAGYDVTYVRNYTDIDDKIIKRSLEEKITAKDVSEKYIQEVEKDYRLAGLLEPTHKTKATEFVPGMLKMIQKLIDRGHAYVVQGEVFYSVESFKTYGKLSGRNLEELQAGARVEVDVKKKNPMDFSLWKPAKPGEPSWESPWAAGRPGWHIECSVMATEIMGDCIDVHHGGPDLIFPHHENEIAQSEGATGHEPFSKYWLHNALITMSQEKMSKSLGNVVLARHFLEKYSTDVTRMMLLSVHYRSNLDFSEETIENTLTSLERLYEAKRRAQKLSKKRVAMPMPRAEGLWAEFVADVELARKEINDAIYNDFNTPGVLGAVFTLIRKFNRVLEEPQVEATPSVVLGADAFLKLLNEDLESILGVGGTDGETACEDLRRIRALSGKIQPHEIEALIAERNQARKDKNFKRADEVRDELLAKNVEIKDGPSGTTWKYR